MEQTSLTLKPDPRFNPASLEQISPNPRPPYGPTWHRRETSLRDLLQIVLKRKWWIAVGMLIVTTLTAIVTFRMTPLYDSTGRVAINREQSDVLGFKEAGRADDGAEDWDYNVMLDTQVKILESHSIALLVIKATGLDKNPPPSWNILPPEKTETDGLSASSMSPKREAALLRAFQGNLRITKVPRTRIVEISFLSPDPRLSANVVNTLINVYIEENFRTKYDSAMNTSNWISRQLTDLQLKVETSQEKLVRYQKANDILGLDEKQNIITSKLNELNEQVVLAEADRIQRQARYEAAKTTSPELVPGVADSQVVQKLREDEARVRGEYAKASVQLGESHPEILQLKQRLEQIEAGLTGEQDRIVKRLHNDYRAAQEREQLLKASLERQKIEANRLNERAIEFSQLKRDVDTNRQLYEGLLQRLKEASVSAGLKSGNIRIVDPARVATRPARPNVLMNLALAILFGAGFGLGLAFLVETWDNTVQTAEEVQALTPLQPFGMIPMSAGQRRKRALLASSAQKQKNGNHQRGDAALITYKQPQSVAAEAYRALRTSIFLSSFGAPPKVIVVTSGLPQEGKTTTSINLAIVLAQKGSKVLLVDGDMRRPTIGKVTGARTRGGLSQILSGTAKFEDCIAPLPDMPSVTVLPAGPVPPYPAELLGSDVMRRYLTQWREQYDHIVIDTPPVLTVTDAVVLATECDLILLVVRAGQTTKTALSRTGELLAQICGKRAGAVVNAVDVQSQAYYYYGSYYGNQAYYSSNSEGEHEQQEQEVTK